MCYSAHLQHHLVLTIPTYTNTFSYLIINYLNTGTKLSLPFYSKCLTEHFACSWNSVNVSYNITTPKKTTASSCSTTFLWRALAYSTLCSTGRFKRQLIRHFTELLKGCSAKTTEGLGRWRDKVTIAMS